VGLVWSRQGWVWLTKGRARKVTKTWKEERLISFLSSFFSSPSAALCLHFYTFSFSLATPKFKPDFCKEQEEYFKNNHATCHASVK
jgi:hypothetical protein